MYEFGTARDAAEILGMTLSAFDRSRLQGTYVYDPTTMTTTRPDLDRQDLRDYLRREHLIAPAFAGYKLPGGRWVFRLDLLREYRNHGWGGATIAGQDAQMKERVGHHRPEATSPP